MLKKPRLLLLFGAALFVTLSLLSQQSSTGLSVEVPFAFSAGEVQLKAGSYTFVDMHRQNRIGVLDQNRKLVAQFRTTRASARQDEENRPRLVFNSYNDTRFLSEIWWSGGQVGHELQPSRSEQELATRTPANQVKRTVLFIK